ncbi:uncharacterized protein LOC127880025 [Dreissena polymorpha]|uniref:Uncharacterized protein n=1 Tax=Dreissena polymorpha TaxID=45954 RepID=A0A9D4HAS3_DREPO|nr:uncharacterized protein LOC127880025 [Dreissena polymorpha]KAH3831342.1 hypothetical protein DPMN_104605 [Dreissena polymorpha]
MNTVSKLKSRDKQYESLVDSNAKLHKDIEELETAYMIHKHYVEEDQNSLQGVLRKEIGGSRWEHGGAGKIRTYKSSKDLIDNETESIGSQTRKSSRSLPKDETFNINLITEKLNIEFIGSDIDYRRLSDLKTRVLKKASTGIIHRENWAEKAKSVPDTRANDVTNGSQPVELVNAESKLDTAGLKRSNSVKKNKPDLTQLVAKTSEKYLIKNENNALKARDKNRSSVKPDNSSARKSRHDLHLAKKSSATVKKSSVAKSLTEYNNGVQVGLETNDIIAETQTVAKPFGLTFAARKPELHTNGDQTPSSRQSNIFQTQPPEPTEIFIDPVNGQIRLGLASNFSDSGTECYVVDGTKILVQSGTTNKSLDGQKLPCSIVDFNRQNIQPEVRDVFGLSGQSLTRQIDSPVNRNTFNVSPFAASKQCNTEVEFWLKGLQIPDVDKYVRIFAENHIDLLDLEFMSAAQLHDMGITAFGALDKILKGIQNLKSQSVRKSAQERDSFSKSRVGRLESSSMEWKSDECENILDSKPGNLKHVGEREHKDWTDSKHREEEHRSSSRLSNVSSSPDFSARNGQSTPSFAANTKSSSAKHAEKKPPSSKPTGKPVNQSKTEENQQKLKRSNSSASQKPSSKLSHLEGKPTKGVLIRPRSASVSRVSSKGQGDKKGNKTDDKKEVKVTRSRSRSADAVKRKALEGVQAAAKRFEELHPRDHHGEGPGVENWDDRKRKRDEMAAKHLHRERVKQMMAIENAAHEEDVHEEAEESDRDADDTLESLVTVNILSAPNQSNHSDPHRSHSINRTQVLEPRSDVRKSQLSNRRILRQSARRQQELHSSVDINRPVLSTYKIVSNPDRDKSHSEPESGYRTDGSTTYSQIEERVLDIQHKIKRLKSQAMSGDEMTLTLVHDLQDQLQHFERQLLEKERELKGFKPDYESRSDPEKERTNSSRSALFSSSSRDVSSMSFPVNSNDSRSQVNNNTSTNGDDGTANRGSKRETQEGMRKEKQIYLQNRQRDFEANRPRQTDPLTSMELDQKDIIFKLEDKIGEGTFSCVYKGDYQGSEVAVKQLRLPLKPQDRNYFAAEVSLLKELRHPRVVLLIGVCTTSKLPVMVLELMSRGSLHNYLRSSECESLDHAMYYQVAKDIAAGMNYLHSHKPEVLHLDLKSMNVLMCESFRAKIADFGFSKLRHDAGVKSKKRSKLQTTNNSLYWMSPELLDKGEVTCKSDVYSFAIILWEMLTRNIPYEGTSVFKVLERVRKNKRPEIPASTPEGLTHLISICWDPNPAKRPQFKEILQILENLSFPPAWRELFQKAGVPDSALQDVNSTRTIISLVTGTLDSGKADVLHSFMISKGKSGNQSSRNQGKLSELAGQKSKSRDLISKHSSRNGTKPGELDSKHSARTCTTISSLKTENWESDTVTSLSAGTSSDESELTLMNLRESSSENEDSASVETSSSSDEEPEASEKKSDRKMKMDVFIPNLELSLQTVRDEFKAERQRIIQETDWTCISMDANTERSHGVIEKTQENKEEMRLHLSSALSGRSTSQSVASVDSSTSQSVASVDSSLSMNESARSRRRDRASSRSVYSEEFLMRESLNNRRPPSPKKRSSFTETSSGRPVILTKHDNELNDTNLAPIISGDERSSSSILKSLQDLGKSAQGSKELEANEVNSSFKRVKTSRSSVTDDTMQVEDIEYFPRSERISSSRREKVEPTVSSSVDVILDHRRPKARNVGTKISPRKRNSYVSSNNADFAKESSELQNKISTEARKLINSEYDNVINERTNRDYDSVQNVTANKIGSESVSTSGSENIRVVLKDMESKAQMNKERTNIIPEPLKSKQSKLQNDDLPVTKQTETVAYKGSVDEDEIRVKLNPEEFELKRKPTITPRRSKTVTKVHDEESLERPEKVRDMGDKPVYKSPRKDHVEGNEEHPKVENDSGVSKHTSQGDANFKVNNNFEFLNVRDTSQPLQFLDVAEDKKEDKKSLAQEQQVDSPKRKTIRVKLCRDPLEPQFQRSEPQHAHKLRLPRETASPVPPAPPPPPLISGSVSMSSCFTSKSVQDIGVRGSMADELKRRVAARQSISEGVRPANPKNPLSNSAILGGKAPNRQRKQPLGASKQSLQLGNIAELTENMVPQQSEGLPSFVLQSLDLQDQKEQLRSISRPHPHQLDDLSNASQEQLCSIAEILKKAVLNRRLAMGEDGDSVSQSLESAATGWSIDTHIG